MSLSCMRLYVWAFPDMTNVTIIIIHNAMRSFICSAFEKIKVQDKKEKIKVPSSMTWSPPVGS